jgi:hypothetical protein
VSFLGGNKMANGPLIIDLMHPMDEVLQFPTIGRVSDQNVEIPLWIKNDGQPFDLTGYRLGFYGRDAKGVAKIALQDPVGPAIEAGRVTFTMPGAAFQAAGQYQEAWFRIEKDGQLVSSLNVKFNVLENNVEFGVDDEPYYSEIEKLITDFKTAIDNSKNEALSIIEDYRQKFQNVTADATWLMDQLDVIAAKIKSNDIATSSQLKQAVADLSTKLITEISKRPTNQDVVTMVERGFANFDGGNPHTIADEATLNSKYPNGTSGVWVAQDTGHKFFWNANTAKWVDGGAYQAVELNDNSVEIDKLAPNATNATVLLDAQGYPDYDDRTHVFDFNSGEQQAAILWGQGQSYRIPAGTTVKNTEVDNYTAIRLLFDTETKTFSTKPWDTKIGKNEIIILTLRDRWGSEIKNTSVSANFPVTINGKLQTPRSSILPSMLTENNATGVYVSPAAIKLPDYDLKNHVLNFNSKISDLDTTATVVYNGESYAIPAGTKVENKVFNQTSNAILIFSTSTKTFDFIKWNDDIPEDSVPLGILRELSGLATNQATQASFSGAFTMTFNGKFAHQLDNDNNSMATIIQSDRFAPDYDDRTHTFRFNSQRRTSTNDGYEPKVILTYNGNQYTLDSDVTVVNTLAVNRQTSVQKLVFNVSTKDFSFVRNDTPTAYNQWIVAIVRDDNSLEQNTLFNTTVIAEFPVTVNGLPQGQTINEKEANMIGILHRGAMDYAPEESLPAYKMARQIGFNHIEGDVQFTKDNVPVMIHDETINRTAFNADGSLLSQDVAVAEHTLAELNQYSYSMIHNKFRPEYKDTKLCTFEDMVKIGKAYNYHLHVELKIEMTKDQVQTLVDIAAKYGMLDNISWQAFTHEWLKPLQEILSESYIRTINSR